MYAIGILLRLTEIYKSIIIIGLDRSGEMQVICTTVAHTYAIILRKINGF